MNSDLEKLIRLQHVENSLRRVEAELAEVPRLRQELDSRLAEEQRRFDETKEALAACQKARRQLESQLQDLEAKRSKYKSQLMEVKTNKEYTAMLHEIEGVEREIRGTEDQILTEMERGETLVGEVKREEGLFKAAEERHRTDLKGLDARARGQEEEAKKLTEDRDSVAATIPPEALYLFQRVARLRGAAVAEARDGICQLCHVKVRPQMYMDLKRNEEIVQCPSCSRILYYEPTAPVVAPQP